ncbi:MAG TPA: ATPase, T2SS/T4P/T4SS family [Magnetospirillaceae bacterium]|jgi:general secretion pathway protein E/type IV pilus assembly protein PilB
MSFEFTDQVGQGGATPAAPAEPATVSNFALGEQGDAIGSSAETIAAVPEAAAPKLEFAADIAAQGPMGGSIPDVAETPAPSLSFASSIESAPLVETKVEPPSAPPPVVESVAPAPTIAKAEPVPTSPSGGARPGIFAAAGVATAAPAPTKPTATVAPTGVQSLMAKPAAPSAAPASSAPSNRPAIFAAAGMPEPAAPTRAASTPVVTAEKPEPAPIPAAPAQSLALAPAHADAAHPAEPPAAPAGGGAPPSSGHGGGSGGGTPPSGGAPGGGGGQPQAAGATPPGGARIGDKLVEMGLISKDQLQVALYERKRTNKLIGTLLVELGFITESALSAVLASASGFERFDAAATVVEPELLKRFPKEVAQRYRVFPVSMEGTTLRLAMADIYDVLALDQAHRFVPQGTEIIPLVSSEAEVLQAIDQYYGYEFSIDGILRELETGKHDTSTQALSGDGYLHPLVRLVNAILLDAVRNGASDIHFEPEGTFLRLRYRIDGVMQQVRTLQKDLWAAVSHRLKIVSGMNIADKLNPQDGRFGFTYGSHRIDFRVACLPTVNGENIVIRILDKSRALMSLDSLGFSDHNMKLLDRLLLRPEGIMVVTGPTGSGKTTTLYAVLNKVSSLERNIMTLEDPVEYELPLIRQSQVREGTGMNFSDGVRALLRQDPDIIFIGEIRDQATATMALRAAMTGHQVYSTLHTNDAASAVPRLHDLGLEHGLLAGNIIGILAQRLVRRCCKACTTRRPATADECRIFGVDPANPPMVAQTVGCDECRFTGYRGRVAVHELLPVNAEIDEMILSGASLAQVRTEARKHGFVPLAEDGIGKVLQGLTTLDSLMRTVDVTSRL